MDWLRAVFHRVNLTDLPQVPSVNHGKNNPKTSTPRHLRAGLSTSHTIEVTSDNRGRLVGNGERAGVELIRQLLHSPDAAAVRRDVINSGRGAAYCFDIDDEQYDVAVILTESSTNGHFRLRYQLTRVGTEVDDVPQLLDMLPDAVVMTNLKGRVIFANQASADIVGADSADALVGQLVWDVVHPEELVAARREGRQIRDGKTVEYVRHRVMRRDGAWVPVEVVTRPSTFMGEPAVLISMHDLTGIETMKKALAETQLLFYNAFHTGPLGIAVVRLSDGVLLDVNPAYCRLSRTKRDELIGSPLTESGIVLEGRTFELMRSDVSNYGSTGEVEVDVELDSEKRTFLISGARIDVTGEPCMLMMVTDLTQYKSTLLALKESEERFRAMADGAPVLIWISDTDGQITYFNERWLNFTGRTLDEEKSLRDREGIHPDDIERYRHVFSSNFDARSPFSIEYRMRRFDGSYRWMLDRGIPRHLPDGSFIGYIGSCVDITDRKTSEQRLLIAKQNAEQVTILRSAFLTNMTHEIRTPLTVILGFTSILRQGVSSGYRRFVELIERSGRRLLLMLDSILDLAQIEANTLEPVIARHNIVDIVDSVVAALTPLAKDKGIELKSDPPKTLYYAYADGSILTRTLNNLLDNAVKFTDKGSVNVWMEEEEDTLAIHIRDTGIGMSEEFKSRMFDAFTQESTGIERTHQGSGLGLTVSRHLIELIGGSLQVESTKGEGSHLTLRLRTVEPSTNGHDES